MRTAIIDRSLVGMEFFEVTNKSDVYLYTVALHEAGADYVEIDLEALARLPKPSVNDSYIFRLNHIDELLIANAFEFKYVVLPLKFSYLISKINKPIILEAQIGEVDLLSYVKIISDNIDLTKIDLLRLVGDFDDDVKSMQRFINKYRLRYSVPIDICPLNDTMQAISFAIAAYFGQADSITIGFGDHDNYTPFEDFMITMATSYKIIVSSNYITGICKAAILSSLIGNVKNSNMKAIISLYQLSPQKIHTIDAPPPGDGRRKTASTKERRQSPSEKVLVDLNLEDEILDEISRILKEIGVNGYSSYQGGKTFLN